MLACKHRTPNIMNRVSTNKRIQVVSALVEGNCIGAIVRDDRYAKHTVLNPLRDLGCACAECHHRNVWSLEELEHFSYFCRAVKGSLNQAIASSAVRSGSSSVMA